MVFTHETSDSVNRYFSLLSHTGYAHYDKVYNLLVMVFIEEILCGPMSEFITEEDYKVITKGINCLYGTCMIPYPSYRKGIIEKIIGAPYSCKVNAKV